MTVPEGLGDDKRAARLAARFDPPEPAAGTGAPGARWEDRNVRWTIWVDTDLRDQILAHQKATGRSLKAVIGELLAAGLEATTVHRPPSTVHRRRPR